MSNNQQATWRDPLIQELIDAAAEDCRACSYWPPEEDTFECWAECHLAVAVVAPGVAVVVRNAQHGAGMGVQVETPPRSAW